MSSVRLYPSPDYPSPDYPSPDRQESAVSKLPDPRLTMIYRLEASLGQPLELGTIIAGHRRIVPLIGGTFTGPELNGTLLPGTSADWQIIRPDGTALGDIRYTLQTERGDLLYVQSRSVRHGSPEVLARLGRGEDVDASDYTFRAATQIEAAAPDLDWLNKGVFVSVAGRQPGGVTYEVYLVA
jgi:Protein of unknown function (DUF3237)